MKRKDFLVIGLVLAVAGILFLLRPLFVEHSQTGPYVKITVADQEPRIVHLSEPQTVTITQADGVENVIDITAEGAVMAHSTCDNQLCVEQGAVTLDNYEYRPLSSFIICLPNKVSVELVPEGSLSE